MRGPKTIDEQLRHAARKEHLKDGLYADHPDRRSGLLIHYAYTVRNFRSDFRKLINEKPLGLQLHPRDVVRKMTAKERNQFAAECERQAQVLTRYAAHLRNSK
jgi:hypothetical protein